MRAAAVNSASENCAVIHIALLFRRKSHKAFNSMTQSSSFCLKLNDPELQHSLISGWSGLVLNGEEAGNDLQ